MRPDGLQDHLAFGESLYEHMTDPTHVPQVIRVSSPVPMRWERWAGWQAGDPRWSFEVINTDALAREQVAQRVVA